MNTKQLLTAVGLFTLSTTVVADEDAWFARPYVGLSLMSNLNSEFANIDSLSGDANVDLSNGFAGGLGIGYRYTENLAIELGWEYRSNDSEVDLTDSSEFDDGNYASNIFYLNGHYSFDKNGKWQPYAGAGLTWIEEVDIDLERGGEEFSYSGNGEVGYQIFVGLSYNLKENWHLQSEFRYGSVADIDLDGEGNETGGFKSIDYETTTIQVGLVFDF